MTSRATEARGPFAPVVPRGAGLLLQRNCACGQHTVGGGQCSGCEKKNAELQRRAFGPETDNHVPPIVHDVLNSPGQPLDTTTRAFMEPRFRHDFSGVRVHTDQRANESARAVNAAAYTVGQNVVFTNRMFRPAEASGRQLLAHELAHVVQQGRGGLSGSSNELSVGAPGSALEAEADHTAARVMANQAPASPQATSATPLLSLRDPDAVAHIMTLGRVNRSGLQFQPTNVTDTQIGVVSVRGGLLSEGSDRLSVIVGQNLTMRTLARQLLPLWNSAIEAIPAGATPDIVAARTPLTEDEMAQGLMVYNQFYLPVPSMTDWRAGLNFPLPAEIDTTTGMTTVNHLQIRALAGGFDPAWTPLLDTHATAVAAVPAATLTADVTAFLARVTTAFARGLHLETRASTNPTEALPFIRETFVQLSAADRLDVAFGFLENLLVPVLARLADQQDGTSILVEVANVIAAAGAPLNARQQTLSDRLDNAIILGTMQAPPAAARTQAEKTITVDTLKLDGSTHNPATDVQVASAIFSQCNVRVQHGVNAEARPGETTTWLTNTDLRAGNNCSSPSAEERRLFRDGSAAHNFTARFRAFFPATFTGVNGSGYSCIPSDSPHALMRNTAVVRNDGDTDSLAHELGHILINLGTHPATGLMSGRPALPAWRVDQISDTHCARLYRNA